MNNDFFVERSNLALKLLDSTQLLIVEETLRRKMTERLFYLVLSRLDQAALLWKFLWCLFPYEAPVLTRLNRTGSILLLLLRIFEDMVELIHVTRAKFEKKLTNELERQRASKMQWGTRRRRAMVRCAGWKTWWRAWNWNCTRCGDPF